MFDREKIYKYVLATCVDEQNYPINNIELLNKRLDYYIDNDLIALCVDDHDCITALGYARPVSSPEDSAISDRVNYDGSILSIDFLKATSREDIDYMFDQLLDRFPGVTHVAFQRLFKNSTRIKTISITRLHYLKNLIGSI